jgi:hypothetical protein
VLFLVFGASGSGKSLALTELRSRRVPRLDVHDFDEIGVPADPSRRWRQEANEVWLRSAADRQADGTDVLLAGQTPLGELLATPSAHRLDGISACLLDCDDETRIERLQARGPTSRARSKVDVDASLSWAAWMRRHAQDPSWMTEVLISGDSLPEMRWDRWSGWRAGDPRWRVRVIDTSEMRVEEVASKLVDWIGEQRSLAGSDVVGMTSDE